MIEVWNSYCQSGILAFGRVVLCIHLFLILSLVERQNEKPEIVSTLLPQAQRHLKF
jgi:hypothetical protein